MNSRSSWLAAAALAVVALAGTSGVASAQVGSGIKAGYVYPDFTAKVFDSTQRTGWQVGFFAGGNRNGVFGVQTEFNWLRTKTELEPTSTTLGTKITLDYLQIPLLLRLNAGTKSFAFYGIAGPTFETKVHESVEGLGGPTNSDFKFGFSDVNVSLMFGGGVELSRFIIEGRYSKGLKTVNALHFDATEFKLNSFAALIGIRFN